jgi:hypothetical protein
MATADLPQTQNGPQPLVRLHHGTDLLSAIDLRDNGLDQARAAAFNATGEFWATTDLAVADTFAQVNPAGGIPARFDFDVPQPVLDALVGTHPPRAYQYGNDVFEFVPASFAMLNQHMMNRQVVSPVP